MLDARSSLNTLTHPPVVYLDLSGRPSKGMKRPLFLHHSAVRPPPFVIHIELGSADPVFARRLAFHVFPALA